MAFTKMSVALATTLLALAPSVRAGFDAAATNNIAIYWGQNSANTAASQQRLSYYCASTEWNIVPLAFMNGISTPVTNFANAGDNCTVYAGTQLLDCPQIEEDIKTCQDQYQKTILISLGGATYTEGGFPDSSSAEAAADNVWGLFGPNTEYENRPFGSAVVDGFDFDYETTTQNFVPFANKLRGYMDAETSKKYYLSAAPQCVFPDAAMGEMLAGQVAFDFVMVQFYNNWCGINNFRAGQATQDAYNFDVWDNWAKTASKNPDVKVLVGVPSNTGAAGSGYLPAEQLAEVVTYSKQYTSFGGVMMWDMSQTYTNDGFLTAVYGSL